MRLVNVLLRGIWTSLEQHIRWRWKIPNGSVGKMRTFTKPWIDFGDVVIDVLFPLVCWLIEGFVNDDRWYIKPAPLFFTKRTLLIQFLCASAGKKSEVIHDSSPQLSLSLPARISASFNILFQVIIGKTMVTILRENQHFYDGAMVPIVIFVVKMTLFYPQHW